MIIRKTVLFILLGFFAFYSYGQVNEKVLADTINFISKEIKALESLNYKQNAYRLNFEDCNLEYERTFLGEEGKWLIYDFWLPDIDEDKMKLDFAEGGWRITLVSPNKRIEYDADYGSGYVSEMHIYGKDQEPLVAIGNALYFAIRSCKGLDRFKR